MSNISDTVIMSTIQGEQLRLHITLGWLSTLSGYTVTAKVVEADMSVLNTSGYPTKAYVGGIVDTLPIIDEFVDDSEFDIVFPQTLSTGYATQPTANSPVYGFVELEIADSGTGNAQQIYKPLRGLVQIRYSPTEEA